MIEEKVMQEMQKRKMIIIDRKEFNQMLSQIHLNVEDSKKILNSMRDKGLLEIRNKMYIAIKKPKWVP